MDDVTSTFISGDNISDIVYGRTNLHVSRLSIYVCWFPSFGAPFYSDCMNVWLKRDLLAMLQLCQF